LALDLTDDIAFDATDLMVEGLFQVNIVVLVLLVAGVEGLGEVESLEAAVDFFVVVWLALVQ
jgi:hypothetical protein